MLFVVFTSVEDLCTNLKLYYLYQLSKDSERVYYRQLNVEPGRALRVGYYSNL